MFFGIFVQGKPSCRVWKPVVPSDMLS